MTSVAKLAPTMPQASQALTALLDHVAAELETPHPSIGPRLPKVAPNLREEARAALPPLRAMLSRSITPEALRAWLLPVVTAVRNGIDREDFQARLIGIHMAVSDLPAAVLTPEALKRALREWPFFPSAADVAALLGQEAAHLRAGARALATIAEAPDPAPPPPTVTERQRLATQCRALADELRTNQEIDATARRSIPGHTDTTQPPKTRPAPNFRPSRGGSDTGRGQ